MSEPILPSFSELVLHSAAFSLDALGKAQREVIDEFQTSSATPLVKVLQMVQLQKAISAVGMFSMFDAILQDELQRGSPDKAQRNPGNRDRITPYSVTLLTGYRIKESE